MLMARAGFSVSPTVSLQEEWVAKRKSGAVFLTA